MLPAAYPLQDSDFIGAIKAYEDVAGVIASSSDADRMPLTSSQIAQMRDAVVKACSNAAQAYLSLIAAMTLGKAGPSGVMMSPGGSSVTSAPAELITPLASLNVGLPSDGSPISSDALSRALYTMVVKHTSDALQIDPENASGTHDKLRYRRGCALFALGAHDRAIADLAGLADPQAGVKLREAKVAAKREADKERRTWAAAFSKNSAGEGSGVDVTDVAAADGQPSTPSRAASSKKAAASDATPSTPVTSSKSKSGKGPKTPSTGAKKEKEAPAPATPSTVSTPSKAPASAPASAADGLGSPITAAVASAASALTDLGSSAASVVSSMLEAVGVKRSPHKEKPAVVVEDEAATANGTAAGEAPAAAAAAVVENGVEASPSTPAAAPSPAAKPAVAPAEVAASSAAASPHVSFAHEAAASSSSAPAPGDADVEEESASTPTAAGAAAAAAPAADSNSSGADSSGSGGGARRKFVGRTPHPSSKLGASLRVDREDKEEEENDDEGAGQASVSEEKEEGGNSDAGAAASAYLLGSTGRKMAAAFDEAAAESSSASDKAAGADDDGTATAVMTKDEDSSGVSPYLWMAGAAAVAAVGLYAVMRKR